MMMSYRNEQPPTVEGKYIEGYAAVYSTPYHVHQLGFSERMQPGCFDRHLVSGASVVSQFAHRADRQLASTDDGSLSVRSDDHGLHYAVRIDDSNPWHQFVVDGIADGLITGSSVSYRSDDYSYCTEDEVDIVDISTGTIIECGPVPMPANPVATVATRALQGFDAELAAGYRAWKATQQRLALLEQLRLSRWAT